MSKSIKKIVKKNARFFFWGIPFLPKAKREAMYTLYLFFKHIDILLDEDMQKKEKVELIKAWREEFNNIYDKKVPATEIGRKIYKNCMRFSLPKEEFLKLFNSLALDVPNPLNAPSLEVFLDYSRGVAGSAINLSLRVLGCEDEELIENLSKNLGNAIKTTLTLKDIKDDALSGHLYIPEEFLEKAEIYSTEPMKVVTDKNLVTAREELAKMNREFFEQTYLLISKLDKTAARPMLGIANIYKKYFDIMSNRGWEIISPKPRVSRTSKMSLILKSFLCKRV